MTPTPKFNAISVLVADMTASVEFYRRCGLVFSEEQFPDGVAKAMHVEAHIGEFRLMFDTHAVAKSFQPDWTPPSGPNEGISLAFDCGSPPRSTECSVYLSQLAHPSI
ncbi:putative drug resistance protein [Gordonia effusa NBRC 100432]|uniref:Putative drug resistance protein n=1 Tax=Gordonia effusa NBRC 100432 TaxID=1077974 RepID=H0R719_9ACTN|nr:hypothetical protein [Gordonia effusa]GAB20870.1 putative drug resistance protein [Gordonia effusa NBRC 100432]